MSFVVQCTCGKTYHAGENLAGKEMQCPACRRAIRVPNSTSTSMKYPPVTAEPAVVHCGCGRQYQAPARLIGKQVTCPGCGNVMVVSASSPTIDDGLGTPTVLEDPFGGFPLSAYQQQAFPAYPLPGPAKPAFKLSPKMIQGMIILGGVSIFMIVLSLTLPPLYRLAHEAVTAAMTAREAAARAAASATATPPPAPAVPQPPPVVTPPIAEPSPVSTPPVSPEPTPTPQPTPPPPEPTPEPPRDIGEPTVPALGASKDTPLRAPSTFHLYQLTNLRIGAAGGGPYPKLIVQWERIRGKESRGFGPALVIRTKEGSFRTVSDVFFAPRSGRDKSGQLIIDLGFRFGPRGPSTPSALEVYMVSQGNFGGETRLYKVSNSCVMGDLGREPKYARDWTAAEEAEYERFKASKSQK